MTSRKPCRRCQCGGSPLKIVGVGPQKFCRATACITARIRLRESALSGFASEIPAAGILPPGPTEPTIIDTGFMLVDFGGKSEPAKPGRSCQCGGDCLRIIGTGQKKYCRNIECVAERKRLREQRLAPKRGLPRPKQNYSCTCPDPLCKNKPCRAIRVAKHNEKRAAKLAALEQKRQAKKLAREGKYERQLARMNAKYRAKIADRPCTCPPPGAPPAPPPGNRCWNAACKKRRQLAELQRLAAAKAQEIELAAQAAGAAPSSARPTPVVGICPDCGGPVRNMREQRCIRCSAIYRTKKDLEGYRDSLPPDCPTQIALYRPIDDDEAVALAVCDSEVDAQKIMDDVIRRECARIREAWSEETYHERAGRVCRPGAFINGWD